MGAWDDLVGVFDNVFKSSFGKSSLRETMSFNGAEVARNVANSKAVSQFNGLGRTAINDMTIGKRTIKKGEAVRAGNISDLRAIIQQESNLSKLEGDSIDAYQLLKKYSVAEPFKMGISSSGIGDESFQKFIGREGKTGIGVGGTFSGYFGDPSMGSDRAKIAFGAASGVGIVARHLQGGNMTTTAQGERNIAGIPFI